MEFWKMHGAGNDFIIVDNRDGQITGSHSEKARLAKELCHRHYGIGADGMMFVENSAVSSSRMSFFNGDGSVAGMCGNGIRCFAKYIHDKGIVQGNEFTVETGDGIKEIQILDSREDLSTVKVNMGVWDNNLIEFDLHVKDRVFTVAYLHLGVPHAVYFITDEQEKNDAVLDRLILDYGSLIEKNPVFKEGSNVNFTEIIDNQNIKVSTWERGAGRTLACGTGASAAVIAASRLKGLDKSIYAEMPGGTVRITVMEDDRVYMEGHAKKICMGTVEYKGEII